MFGFSNDCKKDIKINIMLNALMEDNTDDIFDNYHLTKIDCDFPALVESLNF